MQLGYYVSDGKIHSPRLIKMYLKVHLKLEASAIKISQIKVQSSFKDSLFSLTFLL